MSRIGNRKLVIPEGVTITEENNVVTVKGPKGPPNLRGLYRRLDGHWHQGPNQGHHGGRPRL